MFSELASTQEFADWLAGEPLDPNEYWLIMLAATHSELVPELTEHLNATGTRFFGALYPGLIDGADHHD